MKPLMYFDVLKLRNTLIKHKLPMNERQFNQLTIMGVVMGGSETKEATFKTLKDGYFWDEREISKCWAQWALILDEETLRKLNKTELASK